MPRPSFAGYTKLATEDEAPKGNQAYSHGSADLTAWRRFTSQPVYSHALLLLTHVLVLLLLYIPVTYYIFTQHTALSASSKRLSAWSPALEAISFDPPRHYNGEIVQVNKYRGPALDPPTPEIDAAWHDIGLGVPALRLSEDELEVLDKHEVSGRPFHRIPEESGGEYVGMLEVFHLLHCLDSLRQAMFYNWEHYDTNMSRKAVIAHHDHCIDVLRMSIMCTADVTPITFFDDESLPGRRWPLPDFSSLHSCRNFDAILEWNWNSPRAIRWEDIGNSSTYKPEGGQD